MPQAPGLVPDQAPTTGLPEVNLAVPSEAFGTGVAAAFQHMGTSIEADGDKIWERAVQLQEVQNKTEVDNADSEFIKQSAMKHAEFNAQMGTNAGPDALKKHIEDIEGIRSSIRDGLSNPASQKMFNTVSLSTMGRFITKASDHSAGEVRSAYRQGLAVRQAAQADQVISNPEDPGARNALRATTRNIAVEQGIPAEYQEDFLHKTEIPVNLGIVKSIMDRNPLEGKERLEDFHAKNALDGEAYQEAQRYYQQKALQIAPDIIAGKNMADLRNQTDPERTGATKAEREQQSADDAVKLYPDVPGIAEAARQATGAHYNQHLSDVRDLNWRDKTLVGDILEGHYSPDGKLPTKMSDITSVPGGGKSLDRLTRPQLESVKRGLYNNTIQKVAPTPESDAQFYKLYGQLTGDDPKERAAALDVFVPGLALPADQRTKLRNAQADLHKGTPQDERIGQAMQTMAPSMMGMSKDDRLQFRGAFSLLIEQGIKNNNNKSLPPDEVRKLGGALLQRMPGTGFFSDYPLYQMAIPSDELENRRKQADIEGRTLTDEQHQAEYTRDFYNALKAAGKSRTSAKPTSSAPSINMGSPQP